jgi:hypothetical protein
MANGLGSALIDFGVDGTQYVSLAITGLTTISNTSYVEAFVMMEASTDHTDYEHIIAPIQLRCSTPTTGVGFTIHATADFPLRGDFRVKWVWSD